VTTASGTCEVGPTYVGYRLSGHSRTGGILGAVPSAAVQGRHSKCIISFRKGALYRHQKCTANA